LPGNIIQHEIQELAPMAQSITHEHLYYKDLFSARDAFEKWKEAMESHLNNGAANSEEARENAIKVK